jgi:glutaredoxin
MTEKLRVVLYTKANCGLCDKMKQQMALAQCDEMYSLQEVDIECDPEAYARYRYEIPVLCINGAEAFRHCLQAADFRDHITSLFRREV